VPTCPATVRPNPTVSHPTTHSTTDSSHDFHHITRVVGLATHIHTHTPAPPSSPDLNPLLITLSAYLHDIGDRKYVDASDPTDPATLARSFLLGVGCPPELARDVQDIVNHVSYSNEVKRPDAVRDVLERLPELAVVQDADRLDAIGAVGVGRAFTYAASVRAREVAKRAADAKGRSGSAEMLGEGEWDGDARRRAVPGQNGGTVPSGQVQCHVEVLGSSMNNSIEHFVDKLEKLERMMKTDVGRQMARERTRRLKEFRGWWEEEAGFAVDGGAAQSQQ
jgi:uncharacterized protein